MSTTMAFSPFEMQPARYFEISTLAEISPESVNEPIVLHVLGAPGIHFELGQFAVSLYQYAIRPLENRVAHNDISKFSVKLSIVKDFATEELRVLHFVTFDQLRAKQFVMASPNLFLVTHDCEEGKIFAYIHLAPDQIGSHDFNRFELCLTFRIFELQ